jgi:hypothetical protein
MSTEELKEPAIVPDFHVKLQSDTEQPTGDPGKSLTQEVALLRQQVAQLCQAVRGLVQLQSVLNTAVQQLLKRDGVIGDCAVLR